MKGEALLTIVVPVLNRERELAEMLKSVRAQSVRGFELIIVDNGSVDDSRKIAEIWANKNPDIPTLILTEPTKGQTKARNRGLDEVRTTWVMFFDSDDIMLPGHMARVINAISNNDGVDIIGWNTTVANGPARGRTHRFTKHDSSPWWDLLFFGTFSTQRFCCRTELMRKVGGWNEKIDLWDDIELGARLLEKRPKIVALKGKPTVVINRSSESVTGTDYYKMVTRMEPALQEIVTVLSQKNAFLCDIKRAIMYGYSDRQNKLYQGVNFKNLIKKHNNIYNKIILLISYSSYRAGMRGGARFVKLLYGMKR